MAGGVFGGDGGPFAFVAHDGRSELLMRRREVLAWSWKAKDFFSFSFFFSHCTGTEGEEQRI